MTAPHLAGWTAHPHDPSFYYRDQEVRRESELRAAWEAAQAQSSAPPDVETLRRQTKEPSGRPFVGRAIVDGKIRFTSISQIKLFDPAQYGGCPAKWAWAYVEGVKEPKTEAQLRGSEEYAKQLESYLKTGVDTLGPVLRAAKHLFPAPGSDLAVEQRLGDLGEAVRLRELYLAETDPLKKQEIARQVERAAGITAHLVPVDGAADFRHRRGVYVDADGSVREEERGCVVAEIGDLKTTSRINDYVSRGGAGQFYRGNAKTVEQVLADPQMVGYGVHAAALYPDLTHVRLSHVYAQTKHGFAAAKRSGLLSVEQVRERWRTKTETVVVEMEQLVASRIKAADYPKNPDACDAYGRRCMHESYCVRPARSLVRMFDETATDDEEGAMSESNGFFGSGGGAPPPPTANGQQQQGSLGFFGSSAGAPPPLPQAPTIAPPVPAPSEEERKRRYDEAMAKLQQQLPVEAPRPAVAYGKCRGCGQDVTDLNGSRLQDNRVKHIGCPVNAEPSVMMAVVFDIGAVNPADSPKVDPVAASAPLPPEVIAQIQDPALRERAELHAQATQARAAEEAAKNPQAAKASSGKCVAGGRQVPLTQADVARIKKFPCPECGKALSLKEVAADFTSATLPGHIVPKVDAAPVAPAVVQPPALPQGQGQEMGQLASAIVQQVPPLPTQSSAPPPLPLLVPSASVAATDPAVAEDSKELAQLRIKVAALEGVAFEVFSALTGGAPIHPTLIGKLSVALFVTEPRSQVRS